MAAKDHLYSVEVLKILDANQFWVRQKTSEGLTNEVTSFQELVRQMSTYADMEDVATIHVTSPSPGMICLGKCPSQKGVWCRVKIEIVLQTGRGLMAKCFLLDYGIDNELIPLQDLQPIPSQFLDLPYQAKKCVLYGIQPVSLQLSTDKGVRLVSGLSRTWDISSKVFVTNLIKESSDVKIKITETSSDGTVYVLLYVLKATGELVCLNDLLVSDEYAVYTNKTQSCTDYVKALEFVIRHYKELKQSDKTDGEGSLTYGGDCSTSEQNTNDSLNDVRHSACPVTDSARSSDVSKPDTTESRNTVPRCVERGSVMKRSPEDSQHHSCNNDYPGTGHTEAFFLDDRSGHVVSGHTKTPSPNFTTSALQAPAGRSQVLKTILTSIKTEVRTSAGHGRAPPSESRCNLKMTCRSPFRLSAGSNNTQKQPRIDDMSLCQEGRLSDMTVNTADDRVTSHPLNVSESVSDKNITVENTNNTKSCQDDTNQSGVDHLVIPFTDNRSPQKSNVNMRFQEPEPEDFQVKVFGTSKLSFFPRIEDIPFIEAVKRVLRRFCIKSTTRLQQYMWPAVLRGYSVLGIAPRQNGGKTLGYIPPLLTLLAQKEVYQGLPVSCGPYALVVAANSKRAADIYEYLKRFREEDTTWRVLLISLESMVDSIEIDLLNGCTVLVATPCVFLRMHSRGVTNLTRCSHLIFDDLDIVLEHYSAEVVTTMKLFEEAVSRRGNEDITPRQVIAVSSTYTTEVEDFYGRHMRDPVVIIASQIEAAFAAGVQQIATFCPSTQRAEHLLSQITVNWLTAFQKIIIFVSSDLQAEHLYTILQSASLVTLRAHYALRSSELEEVIKHWALPHRNDSQPVLVCTNDIINQYRSEINDATCIVHYDVPQKKSDLAKRLWCTRRHWKSPFERDKPGASNTTRCLSYFYISESEGAIVGSVIRLLERSQSHIPQKLHQMKAEYEKQNELGKSLNLCDELKAFGQCHSSQRCQLRHVVFGTIDRPGQDVSCVTIPTEGHVKLLITQVVHATRYYARLLEVTDTDGTWNTWSGSEQYSNLLIDMCLWFNNPANEKQYELPEVNKLYAFEDTQHTFNRVQLLQTAGSKSNKVKVFFVDTGAEGIINREDLLKLPDQFAVVPFQAVEIYICRLKPKDRETSWPRHVNAKMACYIQNKELIGKVVLSLGCSLWLDPLVSHVKLQHLNTVIEEYSVRGLLLEDNQADDNPEHLQKLYSLCREELDIPQLELSPREAYTCHNLLVETKTRQLSTTDAPVKVLVQAVDTPDLFYLQLKEDQQDIEQLQRDIVDYLKHNNVERPQTVLPSTLVLAKFPGTSIWNRAKVSRILSDGQYDVFFVDYGDTELVSGSDLLQMPTRFQVIPFYAIEAFLVGLRPVSGKWSEDDGNVLFEVTRTSLTEDEPKILTAKVLCQRTALYTGKYKHGVELKYSTGSYSVNIGCQLVLKNIAKLSNSHELFPQLSVLQSESVAASIVKHCLVIVDTQDVDKQLSSAQQVKRLIESTPRSEQLIKDKVLEALSIVLELRQQETVIELIVNSVLYLVKGNTSLYKELWNQGTLKTISLLLNTITDVGVLDTILVAVRQLVNTESCVPMLNRLHFYDILSVILSQGQSGREQLVLETLSILLRRLSNRELNDIDKCGCLKSIITKLEQSDSVNILCDCLFCLENMAVSCESAKDKIRKNGGVKVICKEFNKWIDVKVKEKALKTLKILAKNNIYNRDLIKEYQTKYNITTCEEQFRSILGQSVPRSEVVCAISPNHRLENTPLPDEFCSDSTPIKSQKPDVKWTQDKWNILLRINVKNVNITDVAMFTKDTVSFRVVKESIEYRFDFHLYDIIVPCRCESEVQIGCVLLGLRKETQGLWPRLLKEKVRLPFLSRDFSQIDEHSSSDESNEQKELQSGPLSVMRKNLGHYVPFSLSKRNTEVGATFPVDDEHESDEDKSDTSFEEYLRNDDSSNKYDYFPL